MILSQMNLREMTMFKSILNLKVMMTLKMKMYLK